MNNYINRNQRNIIVVSNKNRTTRYLNKNIRQCNNKNIGYNINRSNNNLHSNNTNSNSNYYINKNVNSHINSNVNSHSHIDPHINPHINPYINQHIDPCIDPHISSHISSHINSHINPHLSQYVNQNNKKYYENKKKEIEYNYYQNKNTILNEENKYNEDKIKEFKDNLDYHIKIINENSEKIDDLIQKYDNYNIRREDYNKLMTELKQKNSLKSDILNQKLNIKDIGLIDINVKIVVNGHYLKFILSHQGKIKISNLNGNIQLSGLKNIETITGNIDILNLQNSTIYRGIIYYCDGIIKYTLSSRPIIPINIDIDASINIEMNIISVPK